MNIIDAWASEIGVRQSPTGLGRTLLSVFVLCSILPALSQGILSLFSMLVFLIFIGAWCVQVGLPKDGFV